MDEITFVGKGKSLRLLLKFLHFLKPYKGKVAKAWLVLAFSVILQLPMPLLTMFIIDRVIPMRNFALVKVIGLALLGIIVVRSLSILLQRYFLATLRARILFDLKVKLFQHVERLSLKFFHGQRTGYLMSRITQDADAVQNLLTDTLLRFSMNVLTFTAGVILLYVIHWKLATFCILLLPLYLLSIILFSQRIRRVSRTIRERYALVSKDLQESLSGIFLVKAFSSEKREAIRFIRSLKDATRSSVRGEMLNAFATRSSSFISALAPLALLWYGSMEIMKGNLTIGGLVAFNSFIAYLFGPTQSLTNLNFSIQQALASVERIFGVFGLEPEIKEKRGAGELIRAEGRVSFDNVWFSYNGRDMVLKGINLKVEPGERVALVGRSGVGKSTLLNLIPRFFDPTKGRVLIDDMDIREVKLRSLRKLVGIVPQEVFLFSGSIYENIRYGRPDAKEEEIREAARLAYCEEFIQHLPQGYATEVGERGVQLSGGERQRIAIARAILKNPKILIMDEATSQLDSTSERLIQKGLENLFKGRTTFIIAHRLSTVLNMKRIILLDDGKVIGEGSHKELYRRNNLYKKFCDEQFLVAR